MPSGSFIPDAKAIFKKSRKGGHNSEILYRVKMAKLPLLLLQCRQTQKIDIYDENDVKFTWIIEREGIRHYAEVGKTNKNKFHRNMEEIGDLGKFKV